jgi:hypothetical protein
MPYVMVIRLPDPTLTILAMKLMLSDSIRIKLNLKNYEMRLTIFLVMSLLRFFSMCAATSNYLVALSVILKFKNRVWM